MKIDSKEYYIALLSLVMGMIIILMVTQLSLSQGFDMSAINAKWLFLPFGIGFLGLAVPDLFIYVLKGIQFVQHKIGRLLTFIMLTIVFYIFLTPLAFLSRIFSSKKTQNKNSAFVERDYTFSKKDLDKTY